LFISVPAIKFAKIGISEQISYSILDWSSPVYTSAGVMNLIFVLRLLKGRCYGNQ